MKKVLKFLTGTMVLALCFIFTTNAQAVENARLGNLIIEKLDHGGEVGTEFEIKQTHGVDESGDLVEIEGLVIEEWATIDGMIKLTDLPLGRYEVRELIAPSGELVDSKTYTVTIPFFDDHVGGYIYDVHLYTRQEIFSGIKTQSPGGAGLGTIEEIAAAVGKQIDYHIQVQVPDDIHDTVVNEDGIEVPKYTQVVISDELHSALTFVNDSLTVSLSNEPLSFELGKEYIPVFDEENQILNVALTEAGIVHLTPGKILDLEFSVILDQGGTNIGNPTKIMFITQDGNGEQAIHKSQTNKTIVHSECAVDDEGTGRNLITMGAAVVVIGIVLGVGYGLKKSNKK